MKEKYSLTVCTEINAKVKLMNQVGTENAVTCNLCNTTFRFGKSPSGCIKDSFFFDVQQVGSVLQDFSMSTAFPRRQFGTSDMDTSLLDLQLAPSAAVIILPVSPEKVLTAF